MSDYRDRDRDRDRHTYQPFTIQLLYDTTRYVQPLVLRINPGSKGIGTTARRENGRIVFATELETRTQEVTANLTERRMNRRGRRRHRRLNRLERYRKECKKRKGDFPVFELCNVELGLPSCPR